MRDEYGEQGEQIECAQLRLRWCGEHARAAVGAALGGPNCRLPGAVCAGCGGRGGRGLVQSGWFPGGLLLALAGAAGLFLGGARALGSRAGAVAPAAGWMVAVILLTASRPEGDFLFAAGAGSYLFLLGGMAVAVMCATLGVGRQPPGSAARLGK